MADSESLDLTKIHEFLEEFADARDWKPYHSPKNLVMALAGEVGELTELFQWLTPEESAQVMTDARSGSRVRDELADVLIYAIRLGQVLDVNLGSAIWDKLHKNEDRYPADQARGTTKKYTELTQGRE